MPGTSSDTRPPAVPSVSGRSVSKSASACCIGRKTSTAGSPPRAAAPDGAMPSSNETSSLLITVARRARSAVADGPSAPMHQTRRGAITASIPAYRRAIPDPRQYATCPACRGPGQVVRIGTTTCQRARTPCPVPVVSTMTNSPNQPSTTVSNHCSPDQRGIDLRGLDLETASPRSTT